MSATIRIDFDVNAGAISEALKKELDKVQGITTSANSAVENSQIARINSVAKKAVEAESSVVRSTTELRERAEKEISAIRESFTAKKWGDEKKAATAIINEVARLQEQKDTLVRASRLEDITKVEAAQINAEKKDLDRQLATVRRVALENKEVAEHGAGAKVGIMGQSRNLKENNDKGSGFGMGVGIGVAIEGMKMLTEKSESQSKAIAALHAGTDLQMEDMDKIGKSYNMVGDTVAVVAAKTAAYTGAHGEELKKQTEAVLAYGIVTGKSEQMVAKMMGTQTGRDKIFADAERNKLIAQERANDGAAKAAFVQAQLMDMVEKVASTIMTALSPALTAIMPILDSMNVLIDQALKPILAAVVPVIALVAKSITDLAPPITELVSGALMALTPILGVVTDALSVLIPPIVDIVKVISKSLTPVFDQLAPMLKAVANLVVTQLTGSMKILLPSLMAILPPLIDSLVPILVALMPIVTGLANLFSGALNTGINLVSKVLVWLVENAIKPAVKWFGGELSKTIQETAAHITDAIKVISDAVNSVKSFLGLGDKAVDAAKKAGADVLAQQKENDTHAANQANIARLNEEKASKIGLANKLKLGSISSKEEQELREMAESEGDEMLLKQLDAFDAKKSAKHSASAKKAKVDATTAIIELNKQKTDIDGQLFTVSIANLEAYYLTLKETDLKGRRAIKNEIVKYKKSEFDLEKTADDELLKLQEFNLLKEGMNDEDFAEQKEALEIQHLQAALDLAKKNGQKTLDAEIALGTALINQKKRLAKEEADIKKKASDDELALKARVSAQSAKDDDDNAKYAKDKRKAQMDDLAFMAGPFVAGYHKALDMLNTGFFNKLNQNWFMQKTVAGQVLGSIIEGFVKMIEQYLEQKAIALIANLASDTASIASSAAVAAAAAPAASMVSLASFGANAVAASAGITATTGLAKTLAGFEVGGYTGDGRRDQFAGMVHKGEGVLTADEINLIGGEDGFYALRRTIRSMRGYALGGIVGAEGLGNTGFHSHDGIIEYAKENNKGNSGLIATITVPGGIKNNPKNSFDMLSGSSVNSGGALISAINNQTEILSNRFKKNTMINQRRMVLENKVSQRSLSRETV